jgi:ACS family hexuronate transporter-like MFS transporter
MMATPAAAAPVTASRSWPWKVCVFLLFATALSYLDRQALSVVAPVVAAELRLDNAGLGLLLSAFFYAYSAMHVPVGYILDRFNIRRTYALFVALWSISQMLAGLTRGLGELWGARFALGAFETSGQTGAARIIARILPARDRAFANGLMMSGGSLGAIIAPVLMIWLANTVGWRAGFVILGGIGLFWSVAFYLWFRPSPEVLYGKPAVESTEADRMGNLWRNPRMWACLAGAAFCIPVLHVSASWIPTFLVQQWKLPVGTALGGYLFLVYLGLDAGFIGGGALVSWLTRRGLTVAAARRRVMMISAALMCAAIAVPVAPSLAIAVACVFTLNLGRASWGAIFLAFNQDIAPGRVGFVAGTMGCVGAFAGALLVWLFGIVSKSAGFAIPFFVLGALAILGTTSVLLANWEERAHA